MLAEELLEIIDLGESSELECKAAIGGLPRDLWETYSAFANTKGGVIMLGIEEKKGKFFVVGTDVVKLQKEFWDNINNPQKVNVNVLQNDNVFPIKIGDVSVLQINVPRAMRQQKPVSVNPNPYIGTYKRNHEGDYRCSKEEIDMMISESTNVTQDSRIVPNSTMDDLDKESLKVYRQRFTVAKPDSDWNSLNDKEFLKRIGGWAVDRESGQEGVTHAGLITFGTEMNITSVLPHYFLDYREKLSEIPDQRWSHRITSQDGNWSGNIMDFYHKVIKRINEDVQVPFVLEGDNLGRQMDTRVHKALREALLNSLIHANYFGTGKVIIEKEKFHYKFMNPGLLRVPIYKAIEGGTSDARNKFIFKIFSQLGYGEQSGYGLESIHNTWRVQQWEKPTLQEEFRPEQTILILKTTSIIPPELSTFLKENLKDRYYQLNSNEIEILVKICVENITTNTKIQELLGKNSIEVNTILMDLVNEGILGKRGQGRGTEYFLGDLFNYEEQLKLEIEKTHFKDRTTLYNELRKEISDIQGKKRLSPLVLQKAVLKICSNHYLSLQEISSLVNRDEGHLRKTIIGPLVEQKKLSLRYPDVITHKKQAYKTKID